MFTNGAKYIFESAYVIWIHEFYFNLDVLEEEPRPSLRSLLVSDEENLYTVMIYNILLLNRPTLLCTRVCYCWIIPAGSRAFCLLTFASCCNFYSTLLQNELNWVEKRKNKPRFVSFHFRERFARKETETCYSCNVWQALQVSKILPCHRCDWNRYTCLVPTLLVVRGV
jgi:hypothetical protein